MNISSFYYRGALVIPFSELFKVAWLLDNPSCANTNGSYECLVPEAERVAVGWGGHNSDGTSYPPEFNIITKDVVSCTNHLIDNLPGRINSGITSVGYLLLVCGGRHWGGSWISKLTIDKIGELYIGEKCIFRFLAGNQLYEL